MIALNAVVSFFLNFSKGVGQLKLFTLSGVIFALLNALLNIWFLKFIELSVLGYVYANIISALLTILLMFIIGRYYQYVDMSNLSLTTTTAMLRYSIPLIPNAFAWWFTTDASRFFILLFLGAAQNGLYAVATKIPAMLTLLFSVFNQAWQISAIEEEASADRDDYYSNMYNSLISLSFVGITVISALAPLIMHYFVNQTYYDSWKLVPLLLLASTFSNISGLLGSTYIVFKRTRGIFWTTIIGMVLNALFCLLLIPTVGLNGAGLASSIGFFLVMIIRIYDLKKLINIKINFLILINNICTFILLTISLISSISNIVSVILFSYMLISNVVFVLKNKRSF